MANICNAPWEYDVAPFRITDEIWYVGNRDVGAHLIDTGAGLILIDTTYLQTAYLLLESIRICGFDPAEIRYILHTHAHFDHIGATRMLAEKYGCKTYLGAGDAFFFTENQALIWHHETEPYDGVFVPDVLLQDGDKVRLGNTEITCIASPGHTPGNMTFCWETHWKGRAYSCALSGGYYPNTAPSAYLRKYHLRGWRANYRETFERLARISPEIMLGAHPVFNNCFEKAARMTEESNPFIDPQEWHAALAAGKAEFEKICREDPYED